MQNALRPAFFIHKNNILIMRNMCIYYTYYGNNLYRNIMKDGVAYG